MAAAIDERGQANYAGIALVILRPREPLRADVLRPNALGKGQPVRQSHSNFVAAVVAVNQEDVVSVAQHFIDVATKRTIMILNLKFPIRELSSRRLLAHDRKLLIIQWPIDGLKHDHLIFAHLLQYSFAVSLRIPRFAGLAQMIELARSVYAKPDVPDCHPCFHDRQPDILNELIENHIPSKALGQPR